MVAQRGAECADRLHRRADPGRARRPVRGCPRRTRALGVAFKRREADVPAVGADRAERRRCSRGIDRGRTGDPQRTRGDVGRGIRNLVRRGQAASRATSTSGRSRSTRRPPGAIETNTVTDPYSIALTENSTRSVADRSRRQGVAPEAVGEDQAAGDRPARWIARSTSCTSATSRSATSRCPRPNAAPTAPSRARARARRSCGSWRMPGSTPCTCCPRSTSRRSRRTAQRRHSPRATSRRSARLATEQQACIAAVADADGFNWGYDPYHYSAPEGSYAVEPGGRSARRRVPRDGRRAARHGPAGRARRGVQPHRRSRVRARSRCSTRSCPATTSG